MPSKNDEVTDDQFTAEILRNYLVSAVQEMVAITVRTAYSTCFSEGEDFTCALFDRDGRLIAQSAGLPVHSGGLGEAMLHFLDVVDTWQPDDVVLHTDPYTGGTHQSDGSICRPIFFRDELVAFSVNRGHYTDVGGMAPGGWSGTARHVVQEGLRLPAIKLYDAGQLNTSYEEILRSNIRLSHTTWGDIQAQIASGRAAEDRIVSLIEKYGLNVVRSSFDSAIRYSEARFGNALVSIPDGAVKVQSVYMEDDGFGGGPYNVSLTLTKSSSGFVVDFEGTDPQAMATVNCSWGCTLAATYASIIAAVDPMIPMNDGLLSAIKVRAPHGCLVRPTYPAPVYSSTGDPINRVSEAVQLALSDLVPERSVAPSYATGNNMTGWGYIDAEDNVNSEYLWYIFESGGCGARANRDGNSVDWHLMANCKNESMEVWEQRYPVRFRSYSMTTDSAGAGRLRGGLGVQRHIEMLSPTTITANADRHLSGAPGLFGANAGTPNRFGVISSGGAIETFSERFGTASPSKFSNIDLVTGDVLVVEQGGGGGYGPAFERSAQAVADDVAAGYVSPRAALHDYGVVLTSDGSPDDAKTRQRRCSPGSDSSAL